MQHGWLGDGEGNARDGSLTECCDEGARQAFPICWHFCLALLCPVLWVAYLMYWPGYPLVDHGAWSPALGPWVIRLASVCWTGGRLA